MLSTSNSTHYFLTAYTVVRYATAMLVNARAKLIQCLFAHNFWNLVTNSMKQLKY